MIEKLEAAARAAYRDFGKGSKEFNRATSRLWRARHPKANAMACRKRVKRLLAVGLCRNCGARPVSKASKSRCGDCLKYERELWKKRKNHARHT